MSRTPFTPPRVAQQAHVGEGLPARPRGRYVPWDLGQPRPSPRADEPATSTGSNAASAPDPVAREAEEARRAGFAQGLREGTEHADREAAQLRARLGRSVAELGRLRDVLVECYRREMVELALAAAEAVIQEELHQHPEQVQALLERALETLGHPQEVRLTLGPVDRQRLEEYLGEEVAHIRVREDPDLAPGDFRVDAPTGTIENSILDRIHRARQLILGELAGEAES